MQTLSHAVASDLTLFRSSRLRFRSRHGIQSTERFGSNTDPDGDGFVNEMTRADVTAVSVFQATMQVPGRVIPNNPDFDRTVWEGAVGLNDKIIMNTKLYVGNLSFDVTESDLRDMLSQHGPVNEINVIMDKMTGRARGFAFVTMET